MLNAVIVEEHSGNNINIIILCFSHRVEILYDLQEYIRICIYVNNLVNQVCDFAWAKFKKIYEPLNMNLKG